MQLLSADSGYHISLKRKVLLAVGLMVGMVFVVVLSLNIWSEYQKHNAWVHQRGDQMADFLAGALKLPLWNLDHEVVHSALQVVASDPDFLGASVIGSDGSEYVVGTGEHGYSMITFSRDIVYVSQEKEHPLGKLQLVFSTERLRMFLFQRVASGVLWFLLLLAVNLLVIFYGIRLITRPIDRLKENMDSYSRGEYGIEVYGLERRDEIGQIAHMLELLRIHSLEREQIRQQLADANSELEWRVTERTYELAKEVEERKQAEVRAKAADTAKSRFLASMSHEIRTPMNGIIGLTYLALKDRLPPHQEDYLNKIRASAKTLLEIINDVLDFSKIEAGEMQIEQVPFDLCEVLDQISNIFAFEAAEKGMEILFDLDQQTPIDLVGDPVRIQQILVNLTNNAIKFTDHGAVTIRIHPQWLADDQVNLSVEVEDTGIGISEENRAQLFKSFSQADHSVARKYGGTGLGLAISKQLVELMGGEIGVDSTLGVGSIFYFTLPLMLQHGEIVSPVEEVVDAPIMVADDNDRARDVIGKMLRQQHYNVSTAGSLQELIARLQQADDDDQPFQVLLLDWEMSNLGGEQVVQQIERLGLTKAPAIIALTTDAGELARQHVGAQIAAHLVKPVLPTPLRVAVNAVLQQDGSDRGEENRVDLEDEHEPQDHATRRVNLDVLLVEDNMVNQQVAREILKGIGARVSIANDGVEAIEMVENSRYDVVLMDIQMPRMDGLSATRKLRERYTAEQLPIIAMTANVMAEDRERAMASGMNGFLGKPINIPLLIDTLISCCHGNHVDQHGSSGEAKSEISTDEIREEKVMVADGKEEYEWPEQLPGLNVSEGLERLLGSHEIYQQVLKSFVEDNSDFMTTFERELQDEDNENCRRTIHTLKGSAANISANDLSEKSREIELLVIAGEPVSVELRAELRERIDEVMHSIALLIPSNNENEPTNAPGELRPATVDEFAHMERLLQELKTKDLNAAETMKQAEHWLRHVLEAVAVNQLSDMIAKLDFSAAAQLLQQWVEDNR